MIRTNLNAGDRMTVGDAVVTFLGREDGLCRFTVEVGGHAAHHAIRSAERVDILPGIFFMVERRAEGQKGWRGGGGERVRISLEAPPAVQVQKPAKVPCQALSQPCSL